MQQGVILIRYYKKERDYQQQLADLRTWAQSQAIHVSAEIVEKIHSSRSLREPNGLDHLLRLSRQQVVQRVLIWEVSRLGRSTDEIRYMIDELAALGVSIYIQNLRIETLANGQRTPAAGFLISVLDEITKMELEVLRDRILRCRQPDQRRPAEKDRLQRRLATAYLRKYPAVVRNLRAGLSLRKTATLCHVSINTVRKVSTCLFG